MAQINRQRLKMMKRFFNVFLSGFLIFLFSLPIMLHKRFISWLFLMLPWSVLIHRPVVGNITFTRLRMEICMCMISIINLIWYIVLHSQLLPASVGWSPTRATGCCISRMGEQGGVLGMADYSSITY